MNIPKIAIVNYQAGNLRSVQKALEKSGAESTITDNPSEIQSADALVFPGQGANDSSMRHLKTKGLVEPVKNFIISGRPFLGICLGLQLLLEKSDEGNEPGLGVLSGRTRELPPRSKIPHMGWNQVQFHFSHPVLEKIPSNSYFYFVHSYYADPELKKIVAGTTVYGIRFCSAVAWDNVIAVQFHPEKSGDTGLKLYNNFVQLAKDNR